MGTFIIKKTPTGKFNFCLLAANKEKIAVSSQIYASKAWTASQETQRDA